MANLFTKTAGRWLNNIIQYLLNDGSDVAEASHPAPVQRRHAEKLKVFENPPRRLEFPAHFMPHTLDIADTAANILKNISDRLEMNGLSLQTVGRIHIAYPHKDPDLHPAHYNGGLYVAENLRTKMQQIAPHVEWSLADEICETIKLNRTAHGDNAIYAMIKEQLYSINPYLKPQPSAFLNPANDRQDVFIIADDIVEQGTTIASLASYLTHNGGLVLGAVTDGERDILQKGYPDLWPALSAPFNTASGRNTARLDELGEAFRASAAAAEPEITAQQCMTAFNAALEYNGKSVFALTDAECNRISSTVRRDMSFQEMVSKLYVHGRYEKFPKARAQTNTSP